MIDDLDDDDGALPPHLRALLDGGGEGPAMSKGAEARVMSRVLVSVGALTVIGATAATAATAATTTTTSAATTATAATAAATTTTATFLGAGVAKVAMGVAVFVGVATTAVVVQQRPPPAPAPATTTVATTTTTPVPPPVPVVASVPPSAVANPSEPLPIVRVKTTTTPSTTTRPTSTETPPPPTTTAPPIDEVARLEAARAALSAGRADEALAIIEALTVAAPHSAMGEERDALRVLSLVAVGRVDDASVEAAAFLERYPRSLFAPRIRAAVTRGR